MNRIALLGLTGLLLVGAAHAATPAKDSTPALSLEQIMAAPDWIGPAVEDPYWSVDGRSLYFELKRPGSPLRDLYRVSASGGAAVKLSDAELASADGAPLFDRARTRAAFLRHGDVFVRTLADGSTRQLTRSTTSKADLQFSGDGHLLSWRAGQDWWAWNARTGLVTQAATLLTMADPAAAQPHQLERLQLSLFSTLRDEQSNQKAVAERARQLDASDARRAPSPFYLGDAVRIAATSLSPDARWMLVVTQAKTWASGRAAQVVHYVGESGYAENETARTYVGRNDRAPQALLLLDLRDHRQYPLSVMGLPGIHDDPLRALRSARIAALQQQGHRAEADALAAPQIRALAVNFIPRAGGPGPAIVWSDDSQQVAIELRANDNKDRWIASVDFARQQLVSQNRLSDPAWINWTFNSLGWLPDNQTLWFESEASGWAQLFVKPLTGKARALTGTGYESSLPVLSPDGQWFYLLANQEAPDSYDVYRVAVTGGALQRITQLRGLACFDCAAPFLLSPDGSQVALLHSSAYVPPQLAVAPATGGTARALTDTRTPAYKAIAWVQPKLVQIPSSHGKFTVAAKFYQSADYDRSRQHPAVLFVHGAGYLQDVTRGWSYYFREQMFHNLLLQQGYVVLDMDYRGSAGYGRDWRTAIYRQMGHPELEDLLDGKAWLVKTQQVDPRRVGIYGGSYGGFMTEMALLRAPGEFAAGAALRAPSDWTSYNDGYSGNILNTPQLDPEAYRVSSPIEYAQHLQDPLLILHGLIDNNVLPDDSLRLYQRLIELHKQDFWISLYPTERHDFHHADAWHDEYRRILELFTRYVKDRP